MLGDPGRLVYEVDFSSACSWVKVLQNLDRNTMLDSCGGDLSQQQRAPHRDWSLVSLMWDSTCSYWHSSICTVQYCLRIPLL